MKMHQVTLQHMEVLSASQNRIRFLASTPNTVGFSPDGSIMLQYTAAAHFTHELDVDAIVDLNHHQDEVIGRLVHSETDIDGNLIVEIEIDPRYGFFTSIIAENLHDGVSIEGIVTSGNWIDEHTIVIGSYILTGIAVLFTKPPACDKEICNVLSTNQNLKGFLEIYDSVADVDENDPEQLQEVLLAVSSKVLSHEETDMCKCQPTTHTSTTGTADTTDTIVIDTAPYTTNAGTECQCKTKTGLDKLGQEELLALKELIDSKLNNTEISNNGETMSETDANHEEVVAVVAESADEPVAEVTTEVAVETTEDTPEAPEVVAETPEEDVTADAEAPEEVADVEIAEETVETEVAAEETPVEVTPEVAAEPVAEVTVDVIAREDYDAVIAERDDALALNNTLLAASSALKEQLLKAVPEKSMNKQVLSSAAEFVPGYDPEIALSEQDGAIVAKVIAFSSVAGGITAESTSAGASESDRPLGKEANDDKPDTMGIEFPGLTNAVKWASRKQ